MLTQHVKKRFFGRIVAALKVVRERPRCGEGERECGLSENWSHRLVERRYALLQSTWSHKPEVTEGYVSQQGRR